MQLKLTRIEASQLFEFITYLLKTKPFADRAEKIIDILVNQIRIKIRNRLESRSIRSGCSITLSEVEALAFEEYICTTVISVPDGQWVYERNLSNKITAQINLIHG